MRSIRERASIAVSERRGDQVDLCPVDPGFEVGLYVVTDLPTMTRVWMGDVALQAAIGSGRVELTGERALRQGFERWIGLSGFAAIADARCRPRRDYDRGRAKWAPSSVQA